MAAGYASCTGLSILLVDACRSVGVPARIAGVAAWTGMPGNHTWVEVWDHGSWHPVGASESKKLGHAWFLKAASKASTEHPYTRIHATRFKKSPVTFPLIWDLGYPYVNAIDVTESYRRKFTGEK